jgi:hypothetical protein
MEQKKMKEYATNIGDWEFTTNIKGMLAVILSMFILGLIVGFGVANSRGVKMTTDDISIIQSTNDNYGSNAVVTKDYFGNVSVQVK